MALRLKPQYKEPSYDYSKLRMDILQKLIAHREIECRDNRTDMIRHLKIYDEGKYIRDTVVEKFEKTKFLIGIDTANKEHMSKIHKLIEKNSAKEFVCMNGRKYYISNINILEQNELE